MSRAFLWRDRQVKIQPHYQENKLWVWVTIDGQKIGCYNNFEEALNAVRTIVMGSVDLIRTPPFN
jgi:hypothetical protein